MYSAVGELAWSTSLSWIPVHASAIETTELAVDGTNPNSGNEQSLVGPKFESNPKSGRWLSKSKSSGVSAKFHESGIELGMSCPNVIFSKGSDCDVGSWKTHSGSERYRLLRRDRVLCRALHSRSNVCSIFVSPFGRILLGWGCRSRVSFSCTLRLLQDD